MTLIIHVKFYTNLELFDMLLKPTKINILRVFIVHR